MANKNRYTATTVVNALKSSRGLISVAADRLGCHESTVRCYIERFPTVRKALVEERERFKDVAEAALYRAVVNGEAWAVALVVKTLGKDRGYVERQELTGKDGDPIELLDARQALMERISTLHQLEPGSAGD